VAPGQHPAAGNQPPRHHPRPARRITGRHAGHLARALPELRDPGPDWQAWRHQPQPLCPRCDARHADGPVSRLLPHHRYVCTGHRYWTGPADAGQPATPLGPELADIIQAQGRHLRLLRARGTALTYDAVLTGFLICGHLWGHAPRGWDAPWYRWNGRAQALIPAGLEATRFSASRIFAAAYPEAVGLACVIGSPRWRSLAAGDAAQRQQVITQIGRRLGHPGYQPPSHADAIAHWIEYDSWQPPSRPRTTYPQTRDHGAPRPGQPAEPAAARTQRHILRPQPPRRQRHLAPPPHPASSHPRLVTPDGRHRRYHLGQPGNRSPGELDASTAGPDRPIRSFASKTQQT